MPAMKKRFLYTIAAVLILSIPVTSQLPVPAPKQQEGIILTAGIIHTGTGEVIENGAVAFTDGKIVAVGGTGQVTGSYPSFRKIDVAGKHIYPGLIMTGTSLGLSEIGGHEVANDTREFGSYNPGVRALVAYNTDSDIIPVVRSAGVLIAQIVPSGGVLSGSSSVVQLDAWTWDQAAYKPDEGIMLNWPSSGQGRGRAGATAVAGAASGPSAYDTAIEELEKMFSDAKIYATNKSDLGFNLNLEAMAGLFDGTKALYISASGARDIIAAITFANKHGITRKVLLNADEDAWIVRDFIKENGVAVIAGHVHSVPKYEHSDTRMTYRLPAMFLKEGILTGLSHRSTTYGFNLPFLAGNTVAYGLTKEEALQLITLNNARILGIDDRTGSIEKGKDANIVVSTGDILDMLGHNIEYAFIQGREIDLDDKFKQLRDRFQEKYIQK
jgi:imidazolonepropionase-like amidohydrolase